MNFEGFIKKYQKTKVEHFPDQVPGDPRVSVLVQTYNHEAFITDCLKGILEQKTNFNYEILLGEDHSTDGTREICKKFAAKYPDKIRLFLHHPENKIKVLGIITGNFNALYNFYSARGQFIAFCEGDDLWKDPLKLQKQVDVLKENPDLIFTYHSYKEINKEEELIAEDYRLDQPAQNITPEDLKKLFFHPLLSTMCFRNFGNELPEEMAEVINVDSFLLSLLGNYGSAGYLQDIKPSFYLRHEGGMWSGGLKELKFQSKLLTYQKLIHFYIRGGERQTTEFFKKEYIKIKRQLILFYIKKGNIISLLKFLPRGI